MLLKAITFPHTKTNQYPYNLPFIGQTMVLSSPITVLIGENGAGKSTLLRSLQSVLHLYRIAGTDSKVVNPNGNWLSEFVQLSYVRTKPKGFCFSAEDFTTYIQSLEQTKQSAYQAIEEIQVEYESKSAFAKAQAQMPHMRTIHDINQMYSNNLLTVSHGEAYLDFFKSRLRSNELYLLDEPETPLSIQNQLAMLSIIDEAVSRGNQFIIATHSPILMAIPGATIYSLSESGIDQLSYDTIESVQLLKHFLNHREQFFKHLFTKKD